MRLTDDGVVRRSVVIATFVALACSAFIALMVIPLRQEAQTSDEATYVVSGLSYLRTGEFRLNIEHPPLLKELLALPLLLRGATFFANDSDWNGASQWDIAPKVLYKNVAPGQSLLVSARFVNALLAVLVVLVGSYWSYRTWGLSGGLVTLALLAFEPNLIAHGHLATTDVGSALGIMGSVVAFGRFLERPSTTRMVVAAIAFSFAILTRFNALVLVLVLPILYAVALRTSAGSARLGRRTLMKTVGIFLAVSVLATWVSYGFEFRALTSVQDASARRTLERMGAFGRTVARIPLPAASYVSGALWQAGHAAGGQLAYLNGQLKQGGWWYYYPVALVVKMTLGSLALVALAVAATRYGNRKANGSHKVFSGRFILVPAVAILATAMAGRLDIGVRYVLPVTVMMMVAAGGALAASFRPRSALTAIVVAIVALHVGSTLRAFPHFIPYANEAFGGSPKLSKYLNDSNLDWGQDLPLIASYLDRRGIKEYRLSVFSNAPLEAYGLSGTAAPTDLEVPERPYRGVVAVSASQRTYYPDLYRWLSRFTPTVTLGHSINVYDIR